MDEHDHILRLAAALRRLAASTFDYEKQARLGLAERCYDSEWRTLAHHIVEYLCLFHVPASVVDSHPHSCVCDLANHVMQQVRDRE